MLKIASCLTSFFLLFLFSICIDVRADVAFTSAIVVNSNNGKILYSYNADDRIYPASLTKMMTAYVVFDNIKKGVIGMYDKVDKKTYNSKKLESIFPYSNEITIKDLLLKIIVNSLNTPSEILAIETYGNVKSFVDEMNKKAKQFGMTNTHFVNTHGLFNENHYSTARDLANLSIRLVNDFPEYAEMFNITEYINNAEDLEQKTSIIQKNIKGVKGSKTGYISASGFNIAMWGDYDVNDVKEKQKVDHIFAVLIGAKTKQERDELMLKLLSSTIKNKFNASKNIKKNMNNYSKEIANILTFFGLKPEKYMSNRPKMRGTDNKYDYSSYKSEDEEEYFDFTLPNENEQQKEKEELDKNLKNMINVRDRNDNNSDNYNTKEVDNNDIEEYKRDANDDDDDEFMNSLDTSSERNEKNFNLSIKPKSKNRFYMVR